MVLGGKGLIRLLFIYILKKINGDVNQRTDQPTNRQGEYRAICLFWKLENRKKAEICNILYDLEKHSMMFRLCELIYERIYERWIITDFVTYPSPSLSIKRKSFSARLCSPMNSSKESRPSWSFCFIIEINHDCLSHYEYLTIIVWKFFLPDFYLIHPSVWKDLVNFIPGTIKIEIREYTCLSYHLILKFI